MCVRLFVFHGDAQKRVKFSLLRTTKTTTTTTSQAGRPHSVFRSNCSTGAACRLAKKKQKQNKEAKKKFNFFAKCFFCLLLLADFIYLFVAADVVSCLETTPTRTITTAS